MTQDEIIEMARQAGFRVADQFAAAGTDEDMVAFAKLVAEREREACAKVCDTQHKNPQHYTAVGEAKWLSILIRNRGKE